MKASLQMKLDLGLIPTPLRKIRRRFVLTLSGKKSKKREECLCQDIEFQRLLEIIKAQIQLCTTLRKMENQSQRVIFRAQAQTC